jgi:homocysteine S-methyltransferase
MAAIPIRELLSRSDDEVVLLDGGTGGSLDDRGVDVRSDLWSSVTLLTEEGREATRRLHADFFAAGADVVIANVHNVCPDTCRSFLHDEALESYEIPTDVLAAFGDERAALFLAWLEEVGLDVLASALPTDRDVVLAAGIGSQEPWATGTARTGADVEAGLGPCARALRTRPETWLLFETVSTPPELEAVAALARTGELGDFGVGITCGEDGRSWGGIPMADVVAALDGTGLAALFVQCTRYDWAGTALERLLEALAGARDLDAVPGVYANDGRSWVDRRWQGERISPAAYADAAEGWRAAGARIIGGCCGTTPEHVAELRRRWPRGG